MNTDLCAGSAVTSLYHLSSIRVRLAHHNLAEATRKTEMIDAVQAIAFPDCSSRA
jgi:hypothetical protein